MWSSALNSIIYIMDGNCDEDLMEYNTYKPNEVK